MELVSFSIYIPIEIRLGVIMLSSSSIRPLPHQAEYGWKEFGRDRRSGLSDVEIASLMLLHAISYLTKEQLKGNRPVLANRDAMKILCAAGQAMAVTERRRPLRLSMLGWLRRSLYQPLST